MALTEPRTAAAKALVDWYASDAQPLDEFGFASIGDAVLEIERDAPQALVELLRRWVDGSWLRDAEDYCRDCGAGPLVNHAPACLQAETERAIREVV